MLPLSLTKSGEKVLVMLVTGEESNRRHLSELGFVSGETVTVVSDTGDGNLIVKVKETRLAVTKQMAAKIMVRPVAR